jgi:hypothetical protein
MLTADGRFAAGRSIPWQILFLVLGLLVALNRWQSAIPLPVAAVVGLLLGILTFGLMIGVQHRDLSGLLLGVYRRWTGREGLLVSWEPDPLALDERLRSFYGSRLGDFLICCAFHFLGWQADSASRAGMAAGAARGGGGAG